MPSDFRPALITTTSPRTSTTVPLTMAPGFSLARLAWLASNSSANDSVIRFTLLDTWVGGVPFRGMATARLLVDPETQVVCSRKTATHQCATERVQHCLRDHRRCGLEVLPRERIRQPEPEADPSLGNDIIDADACGVDEDSIVCRLQGATVRWVSGVAGHDLAQEVIKVNRNPLVFQLLMPALGAPGAGGQEDLVGHPGRSPCPCRGRRRPGPAAP